MKKALHSCPPTVAKAIDALRAELLTHYHARDFSFTVCAQGHVIGACCLVLGEVRPVAYDAETQADLRERELDRAEQERHSEWLDRMERNADDISIEQGRG